MWANASSFTLEWLLLRISRRVDRGCMAPKENLSNFNGETGPGDEVIVTASQQLPSPHRLPCTTHATATVLANLSECLLLQVITVEPAFSASDHCWAVACAPYVAADPRATHEATGH